MEGATTRRPRTRGPRRGRGVRGGRNATSPLVERNVAVARGRGGRGRRSVRTQGPNIRPGPRTIDELKIYDITEGPIGQCLETPLHPKRMRTWQPSNLTAADTLQLIASSRSMTQIEVESDAITAFSPESQVPSPAMFIEYEDSGQSTVSESTMQLPRQTMRDEDIVHGFNYGSEASSGESSDDELVYPVIPRVCKSTLDTPMDAEDDHLITTTTTTSNASVPADNPTLSVSASANYEPSSLYDFQWKAFPNPPISPNSRRETFSEKNVGPTVPYVDPYDIFVAIWDRQFMEYIASETNRYAQQVTLQMLNNYNLHPNSRISQWRDTTPDELYVYFGLVIAMGIMVKSRMEDYWNVTPDVFYSPCFSAYMSINRFILLNKCLHFVNNEDMYALELDASEAKLFKIRPVLSHLNNKFQSLYKMGQNISLDESLLKWKGWLEINQMLPNKAATVGIKSYEVCESQTGYLWRFEIHTHKRTSTQQSQEDPLNAFTPALVLRLTRGLENKGHTLWMDSYYNSPCLARRLKSLGFDCAGTLRTNRKFVPQALHSLNKGSMRPGQIAGLTSGDIDAMVWRDNNRVSMISTYHGNASAQIENSTKPILILDYNIMMGGVDKKDQMLAMYPIERKRTRVWYKKLFKRLLNVSILNSYIIHHHSSSSHTHRNFRVALVNSLLYKHSSATPLPLAISQNKRVDITHRLVQYQFSNHQRQRRVCCVCKKRVHTCCIGCNKCVCIDPCFLKMHS